MHFMRSIYRSRPAARRGEKRDLDRFGGVLRLAAVAFGLALLLAPAMPSAQAQGLFGDGDAQRREAETNLRINQLEGQIRNLTGQVEQLGFQIRQMQDQMLKVQKDTDFRMQELENAPQTGRRTTPAPLKKSEVTPAPVAPVVSPAAVASMAGPPSTQQPLDTADAVDSGVPTTLSPGADPVPPAGIGSQVNAPRMGPGGQPQILGAPPQVLGQIPGNDDPMAGGTADGPIDLNQAQAPNQPPVVSPVPGVSPKYANVKPTPSARDEYDAAYGYIMTGEYELAERSFRQFLANHPTDRRAGSAQFWLGESYFQRNMHREATDAFLKSYTQYPDDVKAPDSLLKLGLAYQGLGERRAACNAYDELLSKYAKASKALRDRALAEKSRGKCS
jgi:tol-pal system protein YbgF